MKTNEDRILQELCRELQVSRRAVQGYEKYGLVKPTGKTVRGYLLNDAELAYYIEVTARIEQKLLGVISTAQ